MKCNRKGVCHWKKCHRRDALGRCKPKLKRCHRRNWHCNRTRLCRKGHAGAACRRKCPKGRHGRTCRRERCKGHKLGCRFKCLRGGWSRRVLLRKLACLLFGGVHPNWHNFHQSPQQQFEADCADGVIEPDGVTPGPNSEPGSCEHCQPGEIHPGTPGPIPEPGTGPNHDGGDIPAPPEPPESPQLHGGINEHNTFPGPATNGNADNTVVNVGPDGNVGSGWNGVNPRYRGEPDLPPVKRLPEDVEDCVACQYVWKQVEQDVGNSAITQTIYDSFQHNAVEAQKTPIFYPACQTMMDAADDMVTDYMEGFTVDQLCENSMLCRPRDLNQFLKFQRRTKGI